MGDSTVTGHRPRLRRPHDQLLRHHAELTAHQPASTESQELEIEAATEVPEVDRLETQGAVKSRGEEQWLAQEARRKANAADAAVGPGAAASNGDRPAADAVERCAAPEGESGCQVAEAPPDSLGSSRN